MRIIATPIGSYGDVLPFVGIGAELARRGHHVTVVTNDLYEPVVRRAGLAFAPCGTAEQLDRITRAEGLAELRAGAREAFEYVTRHLYRAVAALHVPGDTFLVGHPLAPGTRMVHEALGAPMVQLQPSPSSIPSDRDPPVHAHALASPRAPRWAKRAVQKALEAWVEHEVGAIVTEARAELGLAKVSVTRPEGALIGLFPEWFAPRPGDWPADLALAGFPLFDAGEEGAAEESDELARFLDAGAPPVVFTTGTARRGAEVFFAAAVDACRRLGVRGLLATRAAEQVPGELPAGVRRFSFAPFARLLPRAAAIVHHGGIGTCARALEAGIAQIVAPWGFDQFDNGARLMRLGVGEMTSWSGATGKAIARALEDVMGSSEVASSARTCAERMRAERGVVRACDAMERMGLARLSTGHARPRDEATA